MISIKDTSIFKLLIGNSVEFLGATNLHVREDTITIYELNLLIGCKKSNVFIDSSRTEFFENEDSDMFYDYTVEANIKDASFQKSTVTFNTSEIMQIDIYGRIFNPKDFINYPDLYNEIKEEKQTDDVFLFSCRKAEQIMVVFEPFFPQIEVYFKSSRIEMFWRQYKERYQLHHTIK